MKNLCNYKHTFVITNLFDWGVNNYPIYRFLVYLLYETGIRIGEALALTYNDFETFSYYRKDDPDKPQVRVVPTNDDIKGKHLQGMRVRISKAYVAI